jgi:hypothetical protein
MVDESLSENDYKHITQRLIWGTGARDHFRGHVGGMKLLTVPFHGKIKPIKPRTMNAIYYPSRIQKDEWLS